MPTPTQNFLAIIDKLKEKNISLDEFPVGQMLRFFNEGIKNIDKKLHDKMKENLGPNARNALAGLSEKAKNRKTSSLTEKDFREMIDQLKEFDKDFEDDAWKDFWKEYKPQDRAEELKQQILYAYRFKAIQKVFIDGIASNPPKEIVDAIKAFNKFQQDVNGAILRTPKGQDEYAYIENNQRDTFGSNFVDGINNVISKAIELKGRGVSDEKIMEEIENERLKV